MRSRLKRICGFACCVVASLASPGLSSAADHADAPILTGLGRSDARITDLFAYVRGNNIVLALCTDPTVPPGVTSYLYPSDLTLTINIDSHSKVRFGNEADLAQFGGTVVNPNSISPDRKLTITFDDDGNPHVDADGIADRDLRDASFFAGLRDDPFIRRPRKGRNVAAVVIELPRRALSKNNEPLLIWATTHVPDFDGPIAEHAGRALRSMFIEPANVLTPKELSRELGLVPDVMILDPTHPTMFPNGRTLIDDVVDLVVDLPPDGLMPPEGPEFPTMNDVPFLPDFPYLAPPQ